jgi:hypothetical protein
MILALLSIGLLVLFQGNTHALIPLYALGVFVSFTLSQASMVRYWFRHRRPGWPIRALLNGTGALATGVVAVIIGLTKFTHGAWIVVVLIPCMIALFVTSTALRRGGPPAFGGGRGAPSSAGWARVLVLVGDVHRGMLRAIEYAQSLSPATRVEVDPEQTRWFEERGQAREGCRWSLRSPYRSVTGPPRSTWICSSVRRRTRWSRSPPPEFVPPAGWQHLLLARRRCSSRAPLFRKGVVVTNAPTTSSGSRRAPRCLLPTPGEDQAGGVVSPSA